MANPNPWLLLPFGLLLACMAMLPLLWPAWWRKHFAKLAFSLAAISAAGYFLPQLRNGGALRALHDLAQDYVGFISLIASLYVISGGIRWNMTGNRSTLWKTAFLGLGGVAANVLGTTGASMLLIRPWLQINQSRPRAHHIAFFIFIIANVGGGLTPLGDPPLLVGYLEGVPFWTPLQVVWPMWLTAMAFLLVLFYIIDRKAAGDAPETDWRTSEFSASWSLAAIAIVLAVTIIPMSLWLRAAIMIAASISAYFLTGRDVYKRNGFSFHPIVEVAVLFFAIFVTVMPAREFTHSFAGKMSASSVYWTAGSLSAVLDNAPAFLTFYDTAIGRGYDWKTAISASPQILRMLAALCTATVMFGAVTYIGNGPNLMVKAIADEQKFPTPSFFGFLFKWAVPVMLPLLILLWLVFFR